MPKIVPMQLNRPLSRTNLDRPSFQVHGVDVRMNRAIYRLRMVPREFLCAVRNVIKDNVGSTVTDLY